VTEKFRDYLYGQQCRVYTDNNPLTYVFKTAKLDATGQRWLSDLCTFNLELFYLPGKNNGAADALSRMNIQDVKNTSTVACQSIVRPSHVSLDPGTLPDNPDCPALNLMCSVVTRKDLPSSAHQHLCEHLQVPYPLQPGAVSQMTAAKWCQEQQKDPALSTVRQYLQEGVKPPAHAVKDSTVRNLLRQWDKFKCRNGVLYRQRETPTGPCLQLVLPSSWHSKILVAYHDNLGHVGTERTLHCIQERFYWPGMTEAVKKKVQTCISCAAAKTSSNKADVAPLGTIPASRPMEVVSIDYLQVDKTANPGPPGMP